MAGETIYILSETLARLLADPTIRRFAFRAQATRTHLFIDRGGNEGAGAINGGDLQLWFSPEEMIIDWTDPSQGRRHACLDLQAVSTDEIQDLVNHPWALTTDASIRQAARPGPAPEAAGPLSPFALSSETLAIALRHSKVADLMIGNDGCETMLQAQIRPGLFAIASQAPFDWMGLHLSETAVDLSWFDPQEVFHLQAFRLSEDGEAAEAVVRNPLGALYEACALAPHASSGLALLQQRLAAFTSGASL